MRTKPSKMPFHYARFYGRTQERTACWRPRPNLCQLEDRTAPALFTWVGLGGDQSWLNPQNWDLIGVPGINDDAVVAAIPLLTQVTINGPAAARSITSLVPITVSSGGSLKLAGGVTQIANGLRLYGTLNPLDGTILKDVYTTGSKGFTIGTGQTVNFDGCYIDVPLTVSGTLVLRSAGWTQTEISDTFTVMDQGTLQIDGMGSTAFPLRVQGNMMNKGTVRLTITGSGQATGLRVDGTLTNDPAGLIEVPAGPVGVRTLSAVLDNRGTVNVNADLLVQNTIGGSAVNSGTIDVTGGNMTMSGSGLGSFINTGTLTVAAGRTFTLVNGQFANFNSTTGALSGGTFTIAGSLRVADAAIKSNSANLTLDGAGADVANAATGTSLLSALTSNAAGGTLTLRNGKVLTVPGTFTNAGTLWVTDNSKLLTTSGGDFVQTGGATFIRYGSVLDPTGAVSIQAGVLGGNGRVAAPVTSAGRLSPGNSPGLLTIDGEYVGTGTYLVEMAGTMPGSGYDQLTVNGAVTLSGDLQIALIDGFKAKAFDSFTIIENDGTDLVSGTFTGLAEGARLTVAVAGVSDEAFQISYTGGDGNDVTLTRLPVTISDYAVNGGDPQRSTVTSITVTFSGLVTFVGPATDAFWLDGPAGLVGLTVDLSASTSAKTVATLQFTGPGIFGGSLADGDHQLTVFASQILDDLGDGLDGNLDDPNEDDGGTALHRLFGDYDGDRDVDALDFLNFRSTFGLSSGAAGFIGAFDSNADGDVDAGDFLQFRVRFGTSI